MTDSASLTPECRLVYLTAGPPGNDETIATLARGKLDWERILLIAGRERGIASLWRVLDRTSRDGIPAEVAVALRRNAMVSDFTMLHLQQRLQDTLKALRARGVQGMVIKGCALATTVYPSFVDRPMADIDLLIHPDDITNSRLAMLDAGWGDDHDPLIAPLYTDHHHLVPFRDTAPTGLRLEVHTSLLPHGHPFDSDEGVIWDHATSTGDAYSGVLAPAPVHLLYHACLHFAWSHMMRFGAWRTFRDATELLRGASAFDWDAFVRFAVQGRGQTSCYWTLRLAQRLSEVPVPADVLRRLRAPTPELLQGALERHFIARLAPGESPACPSVHLERTLWNAAIRPGWSGHRRVESAEQPKDWAILDPPTMQVRAHRDIRETTTARAVRHARSLGQWWSYVARTLSP